MTLKEIEVGEQENSTKVKQQSSYVLSCEVLHLWWSRSDPERSEHHTIPPYSRVGRCLRSRQCSMFHLLFSLAVAQTRQEVVLNWLRLSRLDCNIEINTCSIFNLNCYVIFKTSMNVIYVFRNFSVLTTARNIFGSIASLQYKIKLFFCARKEMRTPRRQQLILTKIFILQLLREKNSQ